MSVIVGSARINEYGEISGGKPGDQTGRECGTDEWYLHSLGWVLIRAKDSTAREKIAQNMQAICDNDNIGYDQPRDQTLYKASQPYGFDANKVTVKCDTDCARAVRVCVLYAGIDCPDFYTATEVRVLQNTGAFDVYTDDEHCTSSDLLLRGDILCTRSKGHTVVVLTDGQGAEESTATPYQITNCHTCYLRSGPSTEYKALRVLHAGDNVEFISTANTGWKHVRFGELTGYVSPKYLASACTWISTGKVWMRKSAGVLGTKLQVIPVGTELTGTGKTQLVLGTLWHEVNCCGQIGWVSGKYLTQE